MTSRNERSSRIPLLCPLIKLIIRGGVSNVVIFINTLYLIEER